MQPDPQEKTDICLAAVRYVRDLCGNMTDSTFNASASQAGINESSSFTTDGTDFMSTTPTSLSSNRSSTCSPSDLAPNITNVSTFQGAATTRSDASIAALLAVIAAIALL